MMQWLHILFLALSSVTYAVPTVSSTDASGPLAHLKNGTYSGVHSSEYNQDYFLGVRFAQPPVGDLRLRQPHSLNTTWPGIRNATEYQYACVGYGVDTYVGGSNYVSEDCLTLNIVRPSGYEKPLPVAVWIYGGGWYEGSARDPRYNLSYIVEQSVQIGKPIIGVSINYRLHGWGWLYSEEILKAGVTNLGLRDQRLALEWLQENIHAFGGDRGRVTIWGESAGAVNVGSHILAYNGRDDGLFHGAIAESGPFGVGLVNPTKSVAEIAFTRITTKAGCGNVTDKLACLRKLPFKKYNHVLKSLYPAAEGYHQVIFGPLVDHDIVQRSAVAQLVSGDFIKVPYIMGTNTDEGADFVPTGINTDSQFEHYLRAYGINNATVDTIGKLYPPNSPQNILKNHRGQFGTKIGHQFKRLATVEGDIGLFAPKRLAASQWVNHTQAPLYVYRFNTIPNDVPAYLAATHFTEVGFVFHNVHGVGYTGVGPPPYFSSNPFANKPATYTQLSTMMSRMWASFIADGEPNFTGAEVRWPTYGPAKTEIVFDAVNGSSIEVDDYREKPVQFLVDQYLKAEYPWGAHEQI